MRNGNYITTYTGVHFYILDPHLGEIHAEDIAHALSMLCRANGHLNHFYSVAQHSINCANEAKARGLSKELQLMCLLHDASEAYIVTELGNHHISVVYFLHCVVVLLDRRQPDCVVRLVTQKISSHL